MCSGPAGPGDALIGRFVAEPSLRRTRDRIESVDPLEPLPVRDLPGMLSSSKRGQGVHL